MEHCQKPKDIPIEEYRALLNSLSDTGLSFINNEIHDKMPKGHVSVGALYSVVLHIAAKAICMICENDQAARKRGVEFFCERLPDMVRKALVIPNSHVSKNEH